MCTCWEFLQNSWIISFDSEMQTEELWRGHANST